MNLHITTASLQDMGVSEECIASLVDQVNLVLKSDETPAIKWQKLSKTVLTTHHPFKLHLYLFQTLFPDWPRDPIAQAWTPTQQLISNTNLTEFMQDNHCKNLSSLHQFSIKESNHFWEKIINKLNVVLHKPPSTIVDLSQGLTKPNWLPDALMNIVSSCFTAEKNQTALVYQDHDKRIHAMTYFELEQWVNQIANSFISQGLKPGDPIAIIMPMNDIAIASYLGVIKMGGVVVSIADSFSADEIKTRLHIAGAKAIVTQDYIYGLNKILPLYEKIKKACAALTPRPVAVVLQQEEQTLDAHDIAWNNFLVTTTQFDAINLPAMSPCNIIFSSGTTASPKAIPWNHTTPIKVASDAFFHQNIQPGDVLAWPTNLGWMMGPWLIFAALMNHATIAITAQSPKERAFGEFIQNAKVTMLGVVPTLVAHWRQSGCMTDLDWHAIKCFSSSGECSNPIDMLYLMSLANYKPIIEYCGGTEIGGAYISSTMIEPNYPSLFTTKVMGMDFVILDDTALPAPLGEVALVSPALGLSTTLLNADHDKIYFEHMPKLNGILLRRHGDQIKHYATGQYGILGRVDDAMNLGGIKISTAEIEKVLSGFAKVREVAAVSIAPKNNGPHVLIIFAATDDTLSKDEMIVAMQKKINSELNPLFKIHDLVLVSELPKTASNKIMRRVLREQYIGR